MDRMIANIERTDEGERLRNKLNMNFQALSRGITGNGRTTQIIESASSEYVNNTMSTAIELALRQINQQFEAMEEELRKEISESALDKQELIDLFIPIGGLIICDDENDPRLQYGKWEKIENRFIFGDGWWSSGATGGEASHTLTTSEMPYHSHRIVDESTWALLGRGNGNYAGAVGSYFSPWWGNGWSAQSYGIAAGEGGGAAHNNMPPYIVKQIWRRTA